MREVKTLKEAVSPILWLNCIFCMGIFEIPANRPRFLLSVVYVVLAMSLYLFLFYQGVKIFYDQYGNRYGLFYLVWAINTTVSVLAVILFWRKSENTITIIKRCSMVDVTLETLGIKKGYKRIFHHNIGLLIFWIATLMLLSGMHFIWMYHDMKFAHIIYTNTCFCIPIMTNSVVDTTFAAFLRCIHSKFWHTNVLLNNVVQCANESNFFKIPVEHDNTYITIIRAQYKNRKDKIMHLMQTLRHLHLELTKIAREINSAYCLQLLLELSVHFTIVTACSYYLYTSLSGLSLVVTSTEKILAMCIWGLIYALKLILMNNLCTRVSREAYKTGEIVQSFEACALDDDLREEIHQFTQQIVLNSLNFTAAGFFTINNCLTGKFFATVTTYVVILIQMNTPT